MDGDQSKVSPVQTPPGDGPENFDDEPSSPIAELKPQPVSAPPVDDVSAKQVDEVLYSDVRRGS